MPDTTATPATPFPSNIEIAQRAQMRPIVPLARERLGIPEDSLDSYGRYKAKVSLDYVAQLKGRPDGKLVLVTAISPVIGYGKASKIAHYAVDNDLTLKAAALKLGFVSEAEFDRVVDPKQMVKPHVASAV